MNAGQEHNPTQKNTHFFCDLAPCGPTRAALLTHVLVQSHCLGARSVVAGGESERDPLCTIHTHTHTHTHTPRAPTHPRLPSDYRLEDYICAARLRVQGSARRTRRESPTNTPALTHTKNMSAGRLAAFWASETGPKTTHFWGPVANWGFVLAVSRATLESLSHLAASLQPLDHNWSGTTPHTDIQKTTRIALLFGLLRRGRARALLCSGAAAPCRRAADAARRRLQRTQLLTRRPLALLPHPTHNTRHTNQTRAWPTRRSRPR